MNELENLIQAIKDKDITLFENSLNVLVDYQPKEKDSTLIEMLKIQIVELIRNTQRKANCIDLGQKIYEQKLIDMAYILVIVMNEPFKKLLELSFIKNDLAFLQKLKYETYAKEMDRSNYYVLCKLHEQYNFLAKFSEEDVKPKADVIPLNFHYIWAGKTMPDEELNNLSAMIAVAKINDGKVLLWTDSVTRQEGIYNFLPPFHHRYIEIKNISDLAPLIEQYFKVDVKVMKSFIQQEMVGFHNYAAMSDLVRMLILYFHGGIYLDGDIRLQFSSGRKIGPINSEISFKQLMSFHVYTPDKPSPRNDMLMSSAFHPILREALKTWVVLYHEHRTHALPHALSNTVGFVPMFNDQRRFGQSHYESNSHIDKPKEIGTGNLGVGPIEISLAAFIKKFNEVNQTQKTIKDCAFGYEMKLPGLFEFTKIKREIRLGNLVFDHVMAHKWLNDKNKRSIEI